MQETQVQFPGWEDPLEKAMATHSSILVWEIPWTEEPGGLYSPWNPSKEADTTERLILQKEEPEGSRGLSGGGSCTQPWGGRAPPPAPR